MSATSFPWSVLSAGRARFLGAFTAAALVAAVTISTGVPVYATTDNSSGSALQSALHSLVGQRDGPPGIIVIVRHGDNQTVYRAGTAVAGQSVPMETNDHIRVASVAKAYNGATALSLVAHHVLSLTDTVGKWLPSLPTQWHPVALFELLQHTSGIPDFSQNPAFGQAVQKDPLNPPSPEALLSYARPDRLFNPGSEYHYSNSDNIIVGLMVQAATEKSYESELQSQVLGPLKLAQTSLPKDAALPAPFVSGYDLDPPKAPSDVTNYFAAGWSWASGGVVATPQDLLSFIRAYVTGATTSKAVHEIQFHFRKGASEPPGPGYYSASGLAIYRYETHCGEVYGHTGNTLGYTNFAAASANGSRAVTVQINAQITPKINSGAWPLLHHIYELAVCAALRH